MIGQSSKMPEYLFMCMQMRWRAKENMFPYLAKLINYTNRINTNYNLNIQKTSSEPHMSERIGSGGFCITSFKGK